MSYKHEVKVIFEDGDYLFTTINGSKEDVKAYYVGKLFNCGCVDDEIKKCVDVEFVKERLSEPDKSLNTIIKTCEEINKESKKRDSVEKCSIDKDAR